MPSGNGAAKKVEMTTLAQPNTLADRHEDCKLLLARDFNMDPFKQEYTTDHRRMALVKMAEELRMQQLVPPFTPTRHAHNGRDASVFDLVFASDISICSAPSVAEKVPWNTFCHGQVTLSLKIRQCSKKPTNHPKQQQTTLIIK